ncbi:MAG: UvrB/UvrC motif-containing protein, partial [Bacteroidota bacterium]|nr:UvrB/UvrC motif-containing protein [Bacteroidota bacterium]
SPYAADDLITIAAEEQGEYLTAKKTIPQMEKTISTIKRNMEKAARDLDFMEAARLRDEMFRVQKELQAMQ